MFVEELLAKLGNLKLNLYFSGFILEWIEQERQDFFQEFIPYIKQGKIEVLINGFYEPNYSLIPKERAESQIRKSISFCHKKFGCVPSSMFLPRMLWTDYLSNVLPDCGIRNVAIVDEGRDGITLTGLSENPLKVIGFDLRKARQFFLEGTGVLKKLGQVESPLFLALPAELFTNRVGSDWLFDFLQELKDTNSNSRCVSETDCNKNISRTTIPGMNLGELLWLDVVYNYPYYYFFMDDVGAEKKMLIKSDFLDYLKSFPEMWNMYQLLTRIEDSNDSILKQEKAEKLLSSLEFYGYLWPGIFGGLNYSALRQNFFRESLMLNEMVPSRSKTGLSLETGINGTDEIRFDSDIFGICFDKQTGAITQFDFKPKKCNLLNRRKNYRKILEWRNEMFGTLDEETLSSELNFNQVPSFLRESFALRECDSFRDTGLKLLHTLYRDGSGKNVARAFFETDFGMDCVALKLSKEVSLRDSNNNICVRYHLTNTCATAVENLLRIDFDLGLSHPGYSGSFFRTCTPEETREFGFENRSCFESSGELQVFDGLLGVEIDFCHPVLTCLTAPDYVIDRLPEQYQLVFQGCSVSFFKSISLKPGEECSFEMTFKVTPYA